VHHIMSAVLVSKVLSISTSGIHHATVTSKPHFGWYSLHVLLRTGG